MESEKTVTTNSKRIVYEEDKCKRCGAINSRIMIPNLGEEVCENCGLVYGERIIDETYEKRTFSNDGSGDKKNDSRISGPTKDGASLGTTSVSIERGANPKIKVNRGRVEKTMTEKGFDIIMEKLGNIGVRKNLIEETKNIFSEISQKQKMKGRSLPCMIGAMYYIACRKWGQSLTFDEIAKRLGLEKKRIIKSFNFIRRNIGICSSPDQIYNDVKSLIFNFCVENKNKVDNNMKILAGEIGSNIIKNEFLEGRNTKTLAGLSIFLAYLILKEQSSCIEKLTKKDLANPIFVNESTLVTVFEIIKEKLDILIPEKYQNEIPRIINEFHS